MNAILEVENLSVLLPYPAVRGATFAAEEGSFTAIVGESGSGKSVSALSLSGLIEGARIEGRVTYRGKGRMAYVFQDPASSLDPIMRVGEQVMEAGVSRGEALTLLKKAGLSDAERVFSAYPHELSGGMRQRAMIASALACRPSLLVADEPTSALDALTQADILSLLDALRASERLTILFITHDLPLASRRADTIHVMRSGRIVETMRRGTKGFEPRDEYTKQLFAARL